MNAPEIPSSAGRRFDRPAAEVRSLTATLLARLLEHLVEAVYHYPRCFFYPQAILFLVCLGYTIRHLEFDSSRNNLVGANKKYHQNFLQFKKEFPVQDDLVVVVESENAGKNRQFVERLGARLEAETNLFTDIFFKGDLKMMGNKALLFVPEPDLAELQKTLRDYRPFIEQFTVATNLDSLFALVNQRFRQAASASDADNESFVKALPALRRIVEEAADSLRRPGAPVSPGVDAFFNGGQEAESQKYITFASGRIYLVTARAVDESHTEETVRRLRELVGRTQIEVPGLNVGVTGEPILEIDEMAQSERDTALATIVAFVLVFVIIIFGYGRISRRIKADVCLIVGMVYTMAFTTLAIGHLNILTITFAPILVGIAIDFGVHLIARYEEELQRGRPVREAMRKAMVVTGLGIVTGCLTTAGAFLAMAVTSFRGIQEMGVICGGGMVICLVPMMTLLPVLLLRGATDPVKPEPASSIDRRARIERLWLDRPVAVVALTLAVCSLALTQYFKVGFDYNLLHMQSDGLPAVECEKKLIHSASKSVLFGAIIANNVQEAVKLEAELRKLPAVSSVESLATLLSEDQTRKLALIGDIKREVASLLFADPDPALVQVPHLSQTLWFLQGYLGNAVQEAQKEDPAIANELRGLRDAISEFRKQMLARGEANAPSQLAAFQQALFNDIGDTFRALQTQDNRAPLRVGDLPLPLKNRFIGVTGKVLLQAYPKEDVWQREHQAEFVRELRSVAPNVTGTPVQLLEYTTLLKESYEQAAGYSLVAVAVLVLFHFRRLGYVGLALLPVGVGFLWMVGVMGVAGISFNPANIMTLPLVIGIGVTNGIHILNRFAEEKHPGILARSTGKAVLVSGLTTIVGFGSLILAKHQGIKSLGYVMATGTATCMIVGLTFLPAVLTLLMRGGLSMKQPSVDNARSTLGREEPR